MRPILSSVVAVGVFVAVLSACGSGDGEGASTVSIESHREVRSPVAAVASRAAPGGESWFRDVTAEAGMSTAIHPAYGSSWGDVDGDGWLDVWIGNHMYKPTLYRNSRDGRFIEVTDDLWIGNPELDTHGGAWADHDNDGDPDLLELTGAEKGYGTGGGPFYLNQNGSLTDRAKDVGLDNDLGRGRTPLWLDWNNDGLLDVYVVNEARPGGDLRSPSRLMVQQVNGTFAELPAMTIQASPFAAQLLTVDGAWHLLVHSAIGAYPAAFYRVGDSTPRRFAVAGFPDEQLVTIPPIREVVIGDFDGDLQQELLMLRTGALGVGYSIDPGGRVLNVVKKNIEVERGVTFDAVAASKVVVRLYQAKWHSGEVKLGGSATPISTTRGHCDLHGYDVICVRMELDAFDPRLQGIPAPGLRSQRGFYLGRDSTGVWGAFAVGDSEEFLQFDFTIDSGTIQKVQTIGFTSSPSIARRPFFFKYSSGHFEDRSDGWGIDFPLSCTSAAGGDFDNDGRLDVYMACTDSVGNLRNRLFRNTGSRFEEVENVGGEPAETAWPGGTVSMADYDRDGYLDLLLTDGCTICGPPLRFGRRFLLKNNLAGNRWIQLDLVGCASNRDGIGSRVVIEAGGRSQVRLADSGMRHGVQDQRRIHFGLGQTVTVEKVRVEWPSGRVTTKRGLSADQIHRIREDPNCPRTR